MPEGNEDGRARAVAASVWLLEHAQDLVSATVGLVLIVLAGTELVSGIVDFFAGLKKTSLESAGINLLDRVLLVLILVEIVHTVVLSLRAHHLVAQPFIIVGLVAVIRRVLVVLSGTGTVPAPQLALLIAMIFVFVAALLAVTWFERRWKSAGPADAEQEISLPTARKVQPTASPGSLHGGYARRARQRRRATGAGGWARGRHRARA